MNPIDLPAIAWITAAILALLYLIAGGTKVTLAKERLQQQPRMAYIHDRSAAEVKAIGAVEVLGAVGVIAPLLTGILPWLSAVAAFALAAVQIVAITVHLRRNEHALAFNVVLLVLAIVVGTLLLVD